MYFQKASENIIHYKSLSQLNTYRIGIQVLLWTGIWTKNKNQGAGVNWILTKDSNQKAVGFTTILLGPEMINQMSSLKLRGEEVPKLNNTQLFLTVKPEAACKRTSWVKYCFAAWECCHIQISSTVYSIFHQLWSNSFFKMLQNW